MRSVNMTTIKNDIELSDDINDGEKKQFFLTEESFELLKEVQNRIAEKTELRPTMRKLINVLINKETTEQLILKMVTQLS